MRPSIPGSTAGLLAGLWMLIGLVVVPTDAAETFSPARAAVSFSPQGGATDAAVRALNTAKTQVMHPGR